MRFLIRARPDQYIGLVVTYGIDDTIVSPSPLLNLTSDFQRFSEADENRAAETAEAGLCASPAKNRDKTNQRSPPRSRKAN
ncbi:hypothetical protein AQZ49_13880 [Novosphingobium sp. FSW06-99]|nr:hypothetical protein AQZ49_13880 [Novosphingobium sp. FSW06-99]